MRKVSPHALTMTTTSPSSERAAQYMIHHDKQDEVSLALLYIRINPYHLIPKTTPKVPESLILISPQGVELLGSPYYKGVPLPRIPSVHKLGTKSRIAQRSEHATVDPRGTYSHAGRSTSEPRRQYSRSRGTAQHASTTKIPRNRAVLSAARCTNGILRQSNARRVTLKSQAPVKQ